MPFSSTDTIVAIATPVGRGGLGIVRISGPDAHAIAQALAGRRTSFEPRHATLAIISDRPSPSSEAPPPDQTVITYFTAPHSYTGDEVIEISAHGSPVVLTGIVSAAIALGARAAAPGEFTLRAFLNGRIDLAQAEAVADLVDAATPLQARVAFDQLNGTLTRVIGTLHEALFDLIARLEASVDFPDEGYHFVEPEKLSLEIGALIDRVEALVAEGRRGRMIREGLQVAIVGPPNAGKSSLFNALLGSARAIVTDVPGTTRDLVSEAMDLDGLRITLIDTAGIRDTVDIVEAAGVDRARRAADVADLILSVSDLSVQPEILIQKSDRKRLSVATKSDLVPVWSDPDTIPVSVRTGAGLDTLRSRIRETLSEGAAAERPAVTNVRHVGLLVEAKGALERARAAASRDGAAMPEEFVLADLQEARGHLEEITGRRTSDDVLAHIFERFCIGK